jgi:hypothetical protein
MACVGHGFWGTRFFLGTGIALALGFGRKEMVIYSPFVDKKAERERKKETAASQERGIIPYIHSTRSRALVIDYDCTCEPQARSPEVECAINQSTCNTSLIVSI